MRTLKNLFKKKVKTVTPLVAITKKKIEIVPNTDRCQGILNSISSLTTEFTSVEKSLVGISDKVKFSYRNAYDSKTLENAMKNIKGTSMCLRMIEVIHGLLGEIGGILEGDYKEIVKVYKKVVEIEQAVLKMKENHPDYATTMDAYIGNVGEFVGRFDDYIFKEILEYDGISVLAIEEVVLLKRVGEICRIGATKYKKRLFDCMATEITVKLEMCVKEGSIKEKLGKLAKSIYSQLDNAHCDVGTCFPGFDILSYYAATINMFVREYVGGLVEKKEELDYGDVLDLLYWLRIEYFLVMDDFLIDQVVFLNFSHEIDTLIQHFSIEKTQTLLSGCKVAIDFDFKDPSCLMSTSYGIIMASLIELFSMLNSEWDQIVETKNTRIDFITNRSKTNASSILLYISLVESEIENRIKFVSPRILYGYLNSSFAGNKMLKIYNDRVKKEVDREFFIECEEAFSTLGETCKQAIATICIEESIQNELYGTKSESKVTSRKEYNVVEQLGITLDRFKADQFISKELVGGVYHCILQKFVIVYLVDFMTRGNVDDVIPVDEVRDLFRCFVNDSLEVDLLPLMALKSFLDGLLRAKKDAGMFVFALHEFLRDFPYAWDAAEWICLKCKWLQAVEVVKVIGDLFKKECNSGNDAVAQNHIFCKYIKKYNIYNVPKVKKTVKTIVTSGFTDVKNMVQRLNVQEMDLKDLIGEELNL